MSQPWRSPAVETVGLYPDLVVCDNRVAGAITIGQSRLPVSAILSTAISHDWAEVEAGWSPTEHYGFTESDLRAFLHDVLELRGDFARLILAFANAERVDEDRSDAAMKAEITNEGGDEFGIYDVTNWQGPKAWWEDAELAAPVLDLLRRCVTILEAAT